MQRPTVRGILFAASLLIVSGAGRMARADSINYFSFGDVGASAGVGVGSFDINPTSGTLEAPGSFTLASFQARDLPENSGITYTNLPFYIDVEFFPKAMNPIMDQSEVRIDGVLNGTVTGTYASNVVATITSVQSIGLYPPPFSLGALKVLAPQTLAPGGVNGGTTDLTAQFTSGWTVPEPTPLAMAGLLGLVVVYRRLVCRRRGMG